jgi:hypothetical protein
VRKIEMGEDRKYGKEERKGQVPRTNPFVE